MSPPLRFGGELDSTGRLSSVLRAEVPTGLVKKVGRKQLPTLSRHWLLPKAARPQCMRLPVRWSGDVTVG